MKPHSLDGLSLSFGLIFIGIAVLWLVAWLGALTWSALAWVGAAALVAAGLGGLALALAGARRRAVDRTSR